MKTFIAILLLLAFSVQCFGQTKMIFHKSHSGSNATFNTTLFDSESSNFGAAPERIISNARLDSVIFISATKAVMATSEVCTVSRFYSDSDKASTVWQEGIDTVYNHPLFSKQHNLDSIKKVLRKEYFFTNAIGSVKFVGYDNDKNAAPKKLKTKPKSKKKVKKKRSKRKSKKKPKQEIIPPVATVNIPPPPNSNFPLLPIIFSLGLFSLFVGLITYWKGLVVLDFK